MGIIGGSLGLHMLRSFSPHGPSNVCTGDAYRSVSKLETLFGPQIWCELKGRDVIDLGCGTGTEAIALARRGARSVIGIDIREPVLLQARRCAEEAGVQDWCTFVTETAATADIILSVDSFEHFDDPAGILRLMRSMMREGGYAMVAFGPTWYHPLGGHLFSVFPWAHLVFAENTLLQWRSDFKSDGARRFGEVEGGLNQMTVARFESLVAASGFKAESFEAVPIRRLRHIANRATREFTTSYVRCRLVPS
jgi:SAM-dependent methyltransferase